MPSDPNPVQFRKMGLRRRIRHIWVLRRIERKSKRAARRRDREIAALVKKSR